LDKDHKTNLGRAQESVVQVMGSWNWGFKTWLFEHEIPSILLKQKCGGELASDTTMIWQMSICGLWTTHIMFSFGKKDWGLDISFTIGIQTLMQWFGHWSLDTMEHFPWMPPFTSMSKSIICLQSIMFDHHRQGLLVAWVIISQQIKADLIHCYHWRNGLWMKTPFGGHLVSLWMMPFNNVMQYSTIINFNCFFFKFVISITIRKCGCFNQKIWSKNTQLSSCLTWPKCQFGQVNLELAILTRSFWLVFLLFLK
jgi:hypothetical protein